MRKSMIVDLGDRKITVHELSVKQIYELFSSLKGAEISLIDLGSKILPQISDLSPEELEEMYPSEITKLINAAREVNADFLQMARMIGLGDLADQTLASLRATLLAAPVSSSNPVTVPASGNMDGHIS